MIESIVLGTMKGQKKKLAILKAMPRGMADCISFIVTFEGDAVGRPTDPLDKEYSWLELFWIVICTGWYPFLSKFLFRNFVDSSGVYAFATTWIVFDLKNVDSASKVSTVGILDN